MKVLIAMTCAMLLLACGKQEPPAQIAKPQREALDKAKGLEQSMQKMADDQQKKAEEAEKN